MGRAPRGGRHADGEEVDPIGRPDRRHPGPRRLGDEEVEAEQLAGEVQHRTDRQRVAHLHARRLLRPEAHQQDRDHREHQVEEVLRGEAPGLRDRVVALLARSTAEGETGHAHGHLEYQEASGDPDTGLPIGDTASNLRAAIASETQDGSELYPRMAQMAREEGFDEIADWFETLAKAEQSHAGRFRKALADFDG